MRPQTDDYPEELEQVVLALLLEGREAAAELLAPIAYPRREVAVRAEPSEGVIVSIYKRDRFHCRYCGCRVIPTQIMRLISELFPDDFPYHPNWKGGETHPAIASRSPSLDHVVPWSQGGTNDSENLVCACWSWLGLPRKATRRFGCVDMRRAIDPLAGSPTGER